MSYDFKTQLNKGKSGEKILDNKFSDRFIIKEASLDEEKKKGYDRIFISKNNSETVLLIEYKTDYLAHKTGNAFIETISMDSYNRKGWAYTSQADYLFYFVVKDLLLYIIRMNKVKELVSEWIKEYPVRKSVNNGYNTHGVLVPLCEFEKHSELVLSC